MRYVHAKLSLSALSYPRTEVRDKRVVEMTASKPLIKHEEVAQHSSAKSCWVILHGKVYDVTEFVPIHPGGASLILKCAGKDATEEFDPVHPESILKENLSPSQCIGEIDPESVPPQEEVGNAGDPKDSDNERPRLGKCVNLDDFEKAAEILLSPRAWSYYRSAADDEYTNDWNHQSYRLLRFRPRVLRPVTFVNTTCHMLGYLSSLPIFVAPAAMAKLAHPDGEAALVRAAHINGIIQCTSASASLSYDEIAAAAAPGQVQFYQHYMAADRENAAKQLRGAKGAGYKAILLTVDTVCIGKRERDERQATDIDAVDDDPDASGGVGRSITSHFDFGLSWKDIEWIKGITGLPVALKGIQTAEDASLACQYGAEVIYVSNHGGRQLEGAPSAIETLIEMRRHCPEVFKKCEVWADGGIRRGTDVLKALCLGAKCVGIGRPFLYSLAFGQKGAERVIRILKDEIITGMRLLGVTDLSQLGPALVNSSYFESRVYKNYQQPQKARL